ncbi:MAG: type II secretion system protein N [Oligoflexales bacterium]
MVRQFMLVAMLLWLGVGSSAHSEPDTSRTLVLIGVVGESKKGDTALAVIKDTRSGKTLFVKEGEMVKGLGVKIKEISSKQVVLQQNGVDQIVRFDAGQGGRTSQVEDRPSYGRYSVEDEDEESNTGKVTYPGPPDKRNRGRAYPINRVSRNVWRDADDDDDDSADDDIDIDDEGDPIPTYNGRDPDSDSEMARW